MNKIKDFSFEQFNRRLKKKTLSGYLFQFSITNNYKQVILGVCLYIRWKRSAFPFALERRMTLVFLVERVGRRVTDGAVTALFATGKASDALGEAWTAAGARDFCTATAAGHFSAAPGARHPHGSAAENLFQPKTKRN